MLRRKFCGQIATFAKPETVMRELKTTIRNGIRQLREPPLRNFKSQIDSQILTANNQLLVTNGVQQPLKNGVESKNLTSRNYN